MKTQLTLLTDPIPVGKYFWSESIRTLARIGRSYMDRHSDRSSTKYRGHPAVTRSAVEGLLKIGFSFNYNPKKLKQLAETVVVLAGIRTLSQAIDLKKKGYIKTLIAGTNVTMVPSDFPLIYSKYVDLCITPSQWTCDMYTSDSPLLKGRCLPWAAGVDTTDWCPGVVERSEVLVYIKNRPGENFYDTAEKYCKLLEQRKYTVRKLIYDMNADCKKSYKKEEYKDALNKAKFMLVFTSVESQGIAWSEAWSMDVPTFIEYRDKYVQRGKAICVSAAPYLNDHNGCFFRNLVEFEKLLNDWESNRLRFAPRQWALENMSDEVCARNLYEIIRAI